MIPAEVERLFHRFSQANQRVSSSYGGSGLGLSISKQLVELMGGELRVASEKGKGSCFTVSLPVPVASAAEVAAAQAAALSGQAVLFQPADREARMGERAVRILVVEDNVVNQKLLMNLLARKGYVHDVASNGREALAKL